MNLWICLVNGLFVIAVNGCTKRQPKPNQRDVSNWIERREPVDSSAFDMLLINPSSSSFRLALHTTCQPKRKQKKRETKRHVGNLEGSMLPYFSLAQRNRCRNTKFYRWQSTVTQTWNEIWQRIASAEKFHGILWQDALRSEVWSSEFRMPRQQMSETISFRWSTRSFKFLLHSTYFF